VAFLFARKDGVFLGFVGCVSTFSAALVADASVIFDGCDWLDCCFVGDDGVHPLGGRFNRWFGNTLFPATLSFPGDGLRLGISRFACGLSGVGEGILDRLIIILPPVLAVRRLTDVVEDAADADVFWECTVWLDGTFEVPIIEYPRELGEGGLWNGRWGETGGFRCASLLLAIEDVNAERACSDS
jgi:hypothetical protein